jgi:hypothetical protein
MAIDDEFWNNLIEQKQQPSIPVSNSTLSTDSNVDADALDHSTTYVSNENPPDSASTPREQNKPVNPNEFADPQKQHEMIDSLRSTDGIDYELLRKEAILLVDLRKEMEKKGKMSLFRKVGRETYPQFVSKFPKFFDAIRTVETSRLNEFLNVMHMMLTNLSLVKNNTMSHTEMRNRVFEQDLARKYYCRRK